MATQVGKFAANKLLKKHMKQYQNKNVESGDVSIYENTPKVLRPRSIGILLTDDLQDPFFAMVENPKKPGKYKKVKKQIPAYIPEHDANILASVRRRAYRCI